MTIIKTHTFKNSTIQIVKNNTPVYGGYYSVIAKQRDFESNRKNGLCLDAAIEVFNNSVNFINTQQVFNSIGK